MNINSPEVETEKPKQQMKLIDQIFENYGYGFITYKTFFVVFFIIALQGFHLTFMSNMLIAIQDYFDMSDDHVKFISGLTFLAVGLGSISTGYITKKFKRMTILYIGTFILAVGHICLGLTSNILIFAIIRGVAGVAIGIVVPISLNLLTEYLPIRYRAVMLNSIWLGFDIGVLLLLLLMLLIMPGLEKYKYSETILYSSILSVFSFFLLFFIKDSPRNLLINGEEQKAFDILNCLNRKELTEQEMEVILRDSKGEMGKALRGSFKDIFNKDFRRITVLLALNWMILSVLSYGPMLITSKTIGEIEKEHIHSGGTAERDIIINEIIIYCIYFPSTLIAGLISEIPKLGRNKSNILSLVLCLVFNILIISNYSNYEIHFGIYLFFNGMAFSVSTTYSCEVYPTKVRDIAIGFLFFSTRVAGFISQIIFVSLHNWYVWLPYYVCIALNVLAIVTIALLPVDTYGKPLDEKDTTVKLVLEDKLINE
jgi:MFS family permease